MFFPKCTFVHMLICFSGNLGVKRLAKMILMTLEISSSTEYQDAIYLPRNNGIKVQCHISCQFFLSPIGPNICHKEIFLRSPLDSCKFLGLPFLEANSHHWCVSFWHALWSPILHNYVFTIVRMLEPMSCCWCVSLWNTSEHHDWLCLYMFSIVLFVGICQWRSENSMPSHERHIWGLLPRMEKAIQRSSVSLHLIFWILLPW